MQQVRKIMKRIVSTVILICVIIILTGCGEKYDDSYAAVEVNYDYKSETDLLKKYPSFSEGDSVQIRYDFDRTEYKELLDKYPIAEIAGEGSEFERVMRLVDEYSNRLTHESNYDNRIEENALALLEYSLDQPKHGINCRAKGEILNEMCLALGIYARRVSINPYSSIDTDSHIVNEIYDTKLNKWIMVDMTTDAYFVNEQGEPLSLLEIRQCAVDDKYFALVKQGEKIEVGNDPYDSITYYMKNMFFFKIALYQGFGIKDDLDEVVYFVPEGFNIKDRLISSIKNRMNIFRHDSNSKNLLNSYKNDLKELKTKTIMIGNVDCLRENS